MSGKHHTIAVGVAALAFAMTALSVKAEDLTIGFVTHAQGNPFVEQIVDGAKAAAGDLGVTLKVQESPGGSPESQLKLSQGLANAGAAGVATSMPGDGMAKGMNDIAESGVPVAQFNMLSKAMKGVYVGEKSVQSGRILGKMVVEKLGGASAKGKVIVGICFPGFPVLENRAKGVEESLKVAPGLSVLGPFDVKVSAVDNYNHWEQLYAANPDAVAMIGLCAPDIASLGKLNAAHGDKFVAGGYDLTAENLAAIKGGHAFVSIGQSPFVQGYLPVVLLVEAIKSKKPTPTGFYDSGTQVVTANDVDMGPGLPKVTFEQLEKLSNDPKATAEFYKDWTKKVTAGATPPGIQPVAAESE
jgi:ABC-type sugar transport system substrate-binding protein